MMDDPEADLEHFLHTGSTRRKVTEKQKNWARRILADELRAMHQPVESEPAPRKKEKPAPEPVPDPFKEELAKPGPRRERAETEPAKPSELESFLSTPAERKAPKPIEPRADPLREALSEPTPRKPQPEPEPERRDLLMEALSAPAKPKPQPTSVEAPEPPKDQETPREKWRKSMAHYSDDHLREAAALGATGGPLAIAAQAARDELERREKSERRRT